MTIADCQLLDDLEDEARRRRVYECSLRDPKWHLDGFQCGDAIYIDPRPAILESYLHELIHRRKPRWGERAVTRMARRLIAGMDEGAMVRWWKSYNRVKRRRRPLDVEAE
jgi:hypothetical protein